MQVVDDFFFKSFCLLVLACVHSLLGTQPIWSFDQVRSLGHRICGDSALTQTNSTYVVFSSYWFSFNLP